MQARFVGGLRRSRTANVVFACTMGPALCAAVIRDDSNNEVDLIFAKGRLLCSIPLPPLPPLLSLITLILPLPLLPRALRRTL